MLKTVIVDDEDLFRKSLKSKIDWNGLGLTLVGEASDGADGLKLITQVKPDIVICDIKMPVLDGLSLMKEVHDLYPVKFIILSGYQDFELIRTAIQFGAFDYILKPVRENEMLGVLLRAIENIQAERQQVQKQITDSLAIREALNKYESLFVHFVEIRDVDGINRTVTTCFQRLGIVVSESNYQIILREVLYLAYRICDTFKVDRSIVLEGYNTSFQSGIAFHQLSYVVEITCKLFEIIIKDLAYQKSNDRKNIVQEVIEEIERNYANKLSLEWVAQTFFINPSYFCQVFKSVTNDTFTNYLIKYRISKAKELLQVKNVKVYQVAHMVGYSDEKHFGQLFKKHTGMTPSEYQRTISEAASSDATESSSE